MADKKTEDATDMLDLIYETTHDLTFWPILLDGLNKEIESASGIFSSADDLTGPDPHMPDSTASPPGVLPAAVSIVNCAAPTSDEIALATRLAPHFKRVRALNREYLDLKARHGAMLTVFDQVPIGILFVTRDARIVARNKRAKKILDTCAGLCEVNGCVSARKPVDAERLRQLIDAADITAGRGDGLFTLTLAVEASAVQSVLVVPYAVGFGTHDARAVSTVLLIASPQDCPDISEDALAALFGLTKKEARLAKQVASGKTLASCEKAFYVARDTLKSQLQSIFRKTGVTRQIELVRLILTSPAAFAGEFVRCPPPPCYAHPPSSDAPIARALVLRDDTIVLPDGRRLGFAEYGDPDGVPVMLFHGSYGCRTQRHPDDALTRACGVRLIVPERPGFGMSCAHDRRTFLDWTRDVSCLADQLRLGRFAVIGYGMGGSYACACAFAIGQRLSGVALVNSLAPFLSLSEYHNVMLWEKLLFALARQTPSLFARFAQLTLKGVLNNTEWYFERLPDYLDECDLRVLRDENIAASFRQMIAEAGRNSVLGFVQDMVMVTHDWGFDPARIEIPVHVWQGKASTYVPFPMGERLARLIPKSIPRFFENEGHFVLYSHWRELLTLVTSEHARSGDAETSSGARVLSSQDA